MKDKQSKFPEIEIYFQIKFTRHTFSSKCQLTHLGNVSKDEVDQKRTFCHFRHTLTHYLPSPTHAASDLV